MSDMSTRYLEESLDEQCLYVERRKVTALPTLYTVQWDGEALYDACQSRRDVALVFTHREDALELANATIASMEADTDSVSILQHQLKQKGEWISVLRVKDTPEAYPPPDMLKYLRDSFEEWDAFCYYWPDKNNALPSSAKMYFKDWDLVPKTTNRMWLLC